MGDPFADRPFPRGALLGVAALIGFTLVAVGLARWTGLQGVEQESGHITQSRDLRFEDRAGGLVEVYEASTDKLIARLDPGTENFIRGVLRGLARERRSHDLGMETPFRITRYADGRLTLQDPATGRLIDLQAFGPTNAQSFARLLDADPLAPSPPSRVTGTGTLVSLGGPFDMSCDAARAIQPALEA